MNSSLNKLKLLFISILFVYSPSFAQVHTDSLYFKNKVGVGGWYFGDGDFTLTASFNRIFKSKNELALPINYFSWFNSPKTASAHDVTVGIAFNYSPFKKDTKFNIYLTSEFNFNYYWNNFSGLLQAPSDNTLKRYGPNLYLGVLPSYKISKRLSIQLEYKIGEGYQKANVRDCGHGEFAGDCMYIPQNGWFLKVLLGSKIYLSL